MNERIKELAEQAGINCVVPTVGTLEYPSKGEVDHLEKFAELIVQECLSKIENEAAQYHEPVWAVELVDDIKKHFGV